jgi:4-alpha-glucanotransferase
VKVNALRALARSYGVLSSYVDVRDRIVQAEPQVLLAVLRALGSSLRTVDGAEAALEQRRRALRERLAPPVIVLWDDVPPFVLARVEDVSATRIEGRITLEDGRSIPMQAAIEQLARIGPRRRLPLPDVPNGYHHLFLRAGGRSSESFVIASPRHAYRAPVTGKRSGLFAPLYALRSRDTAFAGDFTELGRLVALTAQHGGELVGTLPFLSTRPGETSPYSPLSRLFWNELYVDPRRTPEWSSLKMPWPSDSDERLIDYEALSDWKRPLLAKLASEARRARPAAFEQYLSRFPIARDYARFRAGKSGDPDEHLYGQLVADEQLTEISDQSRRLGVALQFDLPLGADPSGFDVERERSTFARKVEVGAPPDAVFTHGQRWGFPPLLPERSRSSGHRYWMESLRNSMRHADILRIDHVMGLHRQFWIPEGFAVGQGVYVRYPHEELYAVLNLESHRARCEVVGENLGIVPDAVNQSLRQHGVRGIYVLQYSLTGDTSHPARPVPADCLASLNTHDTPPFAGFVAGVDVTRRRTLGLLSEEHAREELANRWAGIKAFYTSDDREDQLLHWLRFLKESLAELFVVSIEDLWLETESQNLPGTTSVEPNWRHRLRYPLDELPRDILSRLEILRRE